VPEKAKAEVCDLFGLSPQQIERYFKAGMPHRKRGRRVVLPWPEARIWFFKYLEEKGYRRAAPKTLDEARQRKASAEAEMMELELAKARGELMLLTDYERLVGDAFGRVRARLLNFSQRGAGIVLGAASVQEAQARLEPLVREAMDELHRADDIPEPPPDEDEIEEDGDDGPRD